MHRRDFLRLSSAAAATLVLGTLTSPAADAPAASPPAPDGGKPQPAPAFTLPVLPWAKDALAPVISAETISFHYGKHHQAYVNNLNKLIAGTLLDGMSLDEVVLKSTGPLYNNAAQHWAHSLYWLSLHPKGGGKPSGALADAISKDFGSYDQLRTALAAAAIGQFGSGWAWLSVDQGKLVVTATSNADVPLKHGQSALLAIDIWEHAYYIDYRNARAKHVDAVLDQLLDWDAAAARYAQAIKS